MRVKILLVSIFVILFGLCSYAQQSGGSSSQTNVSSAEDSFLITDVWLGNGLVSSDAMILYQNNTVYLPFSFLKNILKISLSFNPSQEVYTGWIYNEKRKVFIDFRAKTASVNGDSYVLSADDMIKQDGEIYFNSNFVDKIFNLEITFDYSAQSVYVKTIGGNLPIQIKQMNAKKRSIFDKTKNGNGSNHADTDGASGAESTPGTESTPGVWGNVGAADAVGQVITDTDFVSPPFLDLSARYTFNKEKSDNGNHFLGYSANAFAVTGGFDSEVYVYDMAQDSPTTIAVKTSKYDVDANLLGFFRKLELGDIYSFSNSAVNYGQSGRGFKLSTYPDDVLEDKVFSIRDVLPLGWEVEIYRNGELLGYQNSNVTGFFEFNDIPLLLGLNLFKLVFYGPQGQVRTEERRYFFQGNVINKGTFDVKLDFIEKNKYVIETRHGVPDYTEGYNGLASVTYGLTDEISLNVSAIYDSVQLLDSGGYIRKEKYYVSAAIAALFKGVYFNLESVADPDRSSASINAYVQTNVYGWDITLQNNYYNDILTERNLYNYDALIENDTQAYVNKNLDFLGLFELPINYSFRYFTTKDKEHQMENSLTLYKTVFRNLYGGVSYQNIQSLNSGDVNLLNFNLNQTMSSYSLRADLSYDFIFNKIRTVNVSIFQDISEKFRIGARYTRDLQNHLTSDYVNRYGASLNWKTRLGYWSAEAGMTDDDTYYAYLGFNISLIFSKKEKKVYPSADKLYGTGAVLAKVFLDKNSNGIYDEGEEVLPDAQVSVSPYNRYVENNSTGPDGCVLIPLVKPYEKMDLDVDLNQIDTSSSLVSLGGNKHFEVRPGQVVHMDYPVIGTGDIEGTVLINGNPEKGIIVKLINTKTGKLVSSKISEFDGHYLFQALPMGEYKIAVDIVQLKDLGFTYKEPKMVNIEKNEQIEIRDLYVSRKGAN